jgi:hypothetical protein
MIKQSIFMKNPFKILTFAAKSKKEHYNGFQI